MKTQAHSARRFALAFLLVLAAAGALAAQTGELKEITHRRDGDKLVVEIQVGGNFWPEVSALNFPSRLILDFTPVERIAVAPYTQVDDVGVLAIRTGQFKTMTARVVFDLGERLPAYSVAPIPGGVRITFWFEGGEEPLPQTPPREKAKPAVTAPEKVRETRVPQVEEPTGPQRTNFFAGLRGGAALLLNRQLLVDSEFSLYAETGTLSETYNFSSVPVFDLTVGKYFNKIKVGAGITFWSLKQEGLFAAAIPHPFQANAHRQVEFTSGPVKNSMHNFYAYVQFAFYDSETFSVWAGGLAGLCKGSFQSLDDYDFTEKSPYTASDVTIGNIASIVDTYSELLFGGLLTFEYRFHPNASLVFDAKMIYANPKILNLGLRANFLQVQPVLGLQVNF